MDYKYIVEIKEVEKPYVLTPSIQGKEMSKEDIIQWYGLDHKDVEWYKIYRIVDGEKVEM